MQIINGETTLVYALMVKLPPLLAILMEATENTKNINVVRTPNGPYVQIGYSIITTKGGLESSVEELTQIQTVLKSKVDLPSEELETVLIEINPTETSKYTEKEVKIDSSDVPDIFKSVVEELRRGRKAK